MLVPAAVATAQSVSSSEATLDKKVRVGVDSSGRKWFLGGFSGLDPLDDSGKRFVTVTDRGPNGDITCNGVAGKEIFVPSYAPRLIYLSVANGRIHLDRVVPLHTGNTLASGLANLPSDESSFATGCVPLPVDPYGVDTEGLTLDPRAAKGKRSPGAFWMADEYRPSLLNVTRHGNVLARLVPGGQLGADYAAAMAQAEDESGDGFDVVQAFPAIVGQRFRHNRGFEDVGLWQSKGRTYLYTALQSPMENPDTTTRKSLAVRVFRVDVTSVSKPKVDREWVYLLEVNPTKKEPLADKVSALWPVGTDRLLIEERDDTPSNVAGASTKVHLVDFSKATNLLGGTFDDPATSPTLEQRYLPTSDGVVPGDPTGVKPGAKSLCLNVSTALTGAGLTNVKLEGMAVVGTGKKARFAAVDDNDFDLAHITDPTGTPASTPTKLDLLPLPATGCS